MGTAPTTTEKITPGQMKDLAAALVQGLPNDMSFAKAEEWLGKKKKLGDHVKAIFAEDVVVVQPPPEPEIVLPAALDWRATYKELGGTDQQYDEAIADLDTSEKAGSWAVLVLNLVRKEGDKEVRLVTPNRVRDVLNRIGAEANPPFTAVSWYSDMDVEFADDPANNIKRNDRNPYRDGSYVIDVEAALEPPADACKSANWRKDRGLVDTTHLEDWLLELAVYTTVKKHINTKRWGKSGASRGSHGSVPCLRFHADRRKVYGSLCSADDSIPVFCARPAVLRQPKVGANS